MLARVTDGANGQTIAFSCSVRAQNDCQSGRFPGLTKAEWGLEGCAVSRGGRWAGGLAGGGLSQVVFEAGAARCEAVYHEGQGRMATNDESGAGGWSSSRIGIEWEAESGDGQRVLRCDAMRCDAARAQRCRAVMRCDARYAMLCYALRSDEGRDGQLQMLGVAGSAVGLVSWD